MSGGRRAARDHLKQSPGPFPARRGELGAAAASSPAVHSPRNTQLSSLLGKSPAVTSGAHGEAAAYGGPAVPPVTRSQGTLKVATKAWCRI